MALGGVAAKIAVTAASGMSGLSVFVQCPVNQRRTCDFWRFSTVFRAPKSPFWPTFRPLPSYSALVVGGMPTNPTYQTEL